MPVSYDDIVAKNKANLDAIKRIQIEQIKPLREANTQLKAEATEILVKALREVMQFRQLHDRYGNVFDLPNTDEEDWNNNSINYEITYFHDEIDLSRIMIHAGHLGYDERFGDSYAIEFSLKDALDPEWMDKQTGFGEQQRKAEHKRKIAQYETLKKELEALDTEVSNGI